MIKVEMDGETMTLRQLSRRFGIKKSTLKERYARGDRGEYLVRPLEKPGPVSPGKERAPKDAVTTKAQIEDLDDMLNVKRERARIAYENKQARLRRQKAALEEMRQLHARMFSQPLISNSLLTRKEREEIVDRVRFSGQRTWAINGAAS